MDIGIALYEDMWALDAVGPYEVLSKLPGAAVTFVGANTGPVRTSDRRLGLVVDATFDDLPAPQIVVVPGGPGQAAMMEDEQMMSWLRSAHTTSTWTTAVCTGSLILGAAGILEGKRAASYWLAVDELRRFGAVPVRGKRFVMDGKVMTAAGVSAGLDMALALVGEIAGREAAERIQLTIEYDPKPPFDAGSPETAPAQVTAYLRSRSRFAHHG